MGSRTVVQRQSVQRQRIGPAIRRLRQERGMTLDALAEQAGISASHLSRLERSQTLPSFTVLAKIAEVLDVGVDEFVQLERDVTVLDEELGRYLDLLGIEPAARDEMFDLSIEARRALVTRLRQLSEASLTRRGVQEAAGRALSEPDIGDACRALNRLLRQDGMSGPAFARAWMRWVETPGERRALVTERSLVLAPPEADMVAAYRAVFGDEPLDPWVASWWETSEWLRDVSVVQRWPVRMLVSPSGLAGLLGSPAERLGPEAVAERVGRLI